MIPLRISPRAAADLDEIGHYIARENPARAATFVDELSEVCERIRHNPGAYVSRSEVVPGLRMAVHRHYVIFFRILADEIRIERVLHGARDIPAHIQG